MSGYYCYGKLKTLLENINVEVKKMNVNNGHLEERVVIAGIEDIESMVLLNDKIYPKEWHVPPAYIRLIMDRNPEVYKIIKTSTGVKGIYGLFPLSKDDYTAVLEGRLEEDEVGNYILDYDSPKTVYLYLVTLIVDIHDVRRKEYASKIIKDIPLELKRLEEKGIDIKEIGANSLSVLKGKRFLLKLVLRIREKK